MAIYHVLLGILLLLLIAMATAIRYLWIKTKRQDLELRKLVSIDQEYHKLLENSPNMIIRYDSQARRIYVSNRFNYYLDKNAEDLIGKTPSEYPGGQSADEYEESVLNVFKTQRNATAHMQWQAENGEERVLRVELLPEFDPQGEMVSVLGIGQYLTVIAENQQATHQLVYFDQLTHLPNRLLLIERIKKIIDPSQHPFALMVLDIDGFKETNDLLGYATSDLLISEVADRLKTVLRSIDMLARLGGDEFAILLPQIQSKAALLVISDEIMALFSRPFEISGQVISITMSMGVALYPDDAQDANQILNYADTAMYHAKEMGRNNTQFYVGDMTLQSLARAELDAALRKAVSHEELVLYYQPQVDLTYHGLIGAEALVRWQHPTLGLLSPDKFIPLAEETGQIIELGAWVLNTSFKAAVAWNKENEVPFKIAVNLSTRQFIRNDLVMSIKTLLAETGCQPQWIKLEITESLLLDKGSDMLNKLFALTELGFDISIDDFGTGYSSLSYLTRYPISQIKIDRSFICDIPIDLEKSALVKLIVQLSKILHLDLVAEGVETEEQAQYLLTNGCYTAQGYLFGRPMPYDQFDDLVRVSRGLVVV